MPPADADELGRFVEQREREARRLEAELQALTVRLGEARRRQEHLQRPSTLLTESARERLADWTGRVRGRMGRR